MPVAKSPNSRIPVRGGEGRGLPPPWGRLAAAAVVVAVGSASLGLLALTTGPRTGSEPPVTLPPTGTRPTVTPTTLEPDSAEQYEAQIKKELRTGHLVYNPPDQMRLGQTRELEVRLTRKPIPEVTTTLVGGGPPVTAEVQVATRMKAELTGSAFDIESRGTPAIQRLRKAGYRSWVWGVTPKKSGTQSLNLTIYALPPEEGSDDALDYRVFSRTIKVEVSPVQSVQGWLGRNLGTIATISAIFGVTAAGAIGAAARRLRRHQGPKAAPGEPGQASGDRAGTNGDRRRRRRQPRQAGRPTAKDGRR
jgi:hypothetical protein